MRFTRISVAFAFGLLAGRAAAAQHYVAPTDQTVVSTTEQSEGDNPSHRIYIENHSTVPITVFSYTLSRCENVRQQCYPHKTDMHVKPGRRELATQVEPKSRDEGFTYVFSYGWHPDSTAVTALSAMAAGGSSGAQDRLAEMRHADSLNRAYSGPPAHELARDEFAALAGRRISLRVAPDSLVMEPGTRTSVERVRLLVVDSAGTVLGRTGWMSWRLSNEAVVTFAPPTSLVAREPGRAIMRIELAEEAQAMLQQSVDGVELPVRVAYAPDPHAPTFAGVALDADSKSPLACAEVALEDSTMNVVARGRTGATGGFRLAAPHAGTYRVRAELRGWMPEYGPSEVGHADETVTHEYPVRFNDQTLVERHGPVDPTAFQHASPAAISSGPMTSAARASAPVLSGVTLGGSESAPIFGIISRVAEGTTWMQFVVDSTGRPDLKSLLLPAGTSPSAEATVRAMLPRVRFSPARDNGRPTCEMLRMQVNFRKS